MSISGYLLGDGLDLCQVRQTVQYFQHAVLQQGGHAVLSGQSRNVGHPGARLNGVPDVITRHQQLVHRDAALVAQPLAHLAALGAV